VPFTYPLMLDVTNRTVVIVGGGGVAVRKVQGLIDAGAQHIRCVSPKFAPDLPLKVQRIGEQFEPRHLEGAGLVFAATDSAAVNAQVVAEAQKRGILVARADTGAAEHDDAGDFSTPALWRDPGGVTLTVSAGGAPLLATLIRDHLARNIDPRHLRMAEAMKELRPMIRAQAHWLPADRRRAFEMLATDEAIGVLEQQGIEGLRQWLTDSLAKRP
jgi:precorrin-2 dehydrogenase/sirohydrochlorin ferrochelatase